MRIPPPSLLARPRRGLLLVLGLCFATLLLWRARGLIFTTASLLTLPLTWRRHSSSFLISPEADGFDLSFASYDRRQDTAGDGHTDLVPPVLHHIVLGNRPSSQKWRDARQSCLDLHPGWEAHSWDDEKARKFVADKFPDFLATWDGYRYPIQRVDALRYLVLWEYGGEFFLSRKEVDDGGLIECLQASFSTWTSSASDPSAHCGDSASWRRPRSRPASRLAS